MLSQKFCQRFDLHLQFFFWAKHKLGRKFVPARYSQPSRYFLLWRLAHSTFQCHFLLTLLATAYSIPLCHGGGGWIPPPHWKTHSVGSETNYFSFIRSWICLKLGRIQKFRPLALKMGPWKFFEKQIFCTLRTAKKWSPAKIFSLPQNFNFLTLVFCKHSILDNVKTLASEIYFGMFLVSF